MHEIIEEEDKEENGQIDQLPNDVDEQLEESNLAIRMQTKAVNSNALVLNSSSMRPRNEDPRREVVDRFVVYTPHKNLIDRSTQYE